MTKWVLRYGDFLKLKDSLPTLDPSTATVKQHIEIIEKHFEKYDVKIYYGGHYSVVHDENHKTYLVFSRGNVFTIDVYTEQKKVEEDEKSSSWLSWFTGK